MRGKLIAFKTECYYRNTFSFEYTLIAPFTSPLSERDGIK